MDPNNNEPQVPVQTPPIVQTPPPPVQTVPPVQTPPPVIPPETKKSSPLTIIAIVLVVVALISVAAYLIGTKFLSRKVVPTPTPVVTSVPTATPDLTANWKTFISTAAYSLKYPESWPMESEINTGCDTCIEDLRFTPNPQAGGSSIAVVLAFKDPRIKTLQDYKNIIIKGDSSIIDVKDAKVGNKDAISYKLSGGIPPLPIIEYAVVNNNYYYIIRLENSDETNRDLAGNQNIFDQILSTFEFTK